MASTGALFGSIGSAVGDIFGAFGDFEESKGYSTAAKLASQNAQITAQSTAIQLMQAQRQTYQVIGGQMADVAGAGLKETGSAVDLLRSSQQQASLQKQLIENQGLIQMKGYEAQAAADKAQASAASTGGLGGLVGGALSIAGAIFGL